MLLATLHGGEAAAAVHLRRAHDSIRTGWRSLAATGNPPGEDTSLQVASTVEAPPGLDQRRRRTWSASAPAVWRLVEGSSAKGGAGPASDANEPGDHARVIHQLLEESLLSLARQQRLRRAAGRRSGWLLWVAAMSALIGIACVVVAAISAAGVGSRGTPSGAPSGDRAQAKVQVNAEELGAAKLAGTPWDAPGNVIIPTTPGHLMVDLGHVSHATVIELSLDNNDRYKIELMHDGDALATSFVGPEPEGMGLEVYCMDVAADAAAQGFDGLRVTPVDGDTSWSIGHLRVLDRASCDGFRPSDGS